MFWGWIFTGLVAGALARILTPGTGPRGCFVTILLGVGGALLAGYVGQQIGWYAANEKASLIASTLGAIAILILYRKLAR